MACVYKSILCGSVGDLIARPVPRTVAVGIGVGQPYSCPYDTLHGDDDDGGDEAVWMGNLR